MSMSSDRVLFTLPARRTYRDKEGYGEVLKKAFNIRPDEWSIYEDFHILCRPSQFARFLILRNQAGISNSFMELHPKLVSPRTFDVLEVWRRPNGMDACDYRDCGDDD